MNDTSSSFNADPYSNPFFHDFILFLRRLEREPIKQTVTGAISFKNIGDLLTGFKQQEHILEYKKYGWHLRREEELDFLTQIKIISEVMFLIYKRKSFLHLSKNGQGFLRNLTTVEQYKQMVMHFWERVNWGYFSRGREVNGKNLAETLQNYRNEIWKEILKAGSDWHDYKKFCWVLYGKLDLEQYIDKDFDLEYELLFQINLALFRRNLVRFGCVEVVEEHTKHDWHEEIGKFRLTPLGLCVFGDLDQSVC